MFVIKLDMVYIFNKVNVKYLNNIYFYNFIFLIIVCLIIVKLEMGFFFYISL